MVEGVQFKSLNSGRLVMNILTSFHNNTSSVLTFPTDLRQLKGEVSSLNYHHATRSALFHLS